MDIRAFTRAHIQPVDLERAWSRVGSAAASTIVHIGVAAILIAALGATREFDAPRETRRSVPMEVALVDLAMAPEPIADAAPEPPPELVFDPEPLPVSEPEPEPIPEPDPQPEVSPPPPEPEPPPPEPRPDPPPEPLPQVIPAPAPPPEPAPEPPKPMAAVTPAPRPAAPAPTPPPVPAPPQQKPAEKKPEVAKPDPGADKRLGPSVLAEAPATGGDSVFLPPSARLEPGGPAGLRGLMGDPCESRLGMKPKECVDNWRGRVGTMDSLLPRSKDDLREHYAEFIAPCPYKVGCEGGEWISNSGTRSVAGTPGAGGAASTNNGLGAGRAILNPDHVDPGFGD